MNDNPAKPAVAAPPMRAQMIRPESCKNCKWAWPSGGNSFQCRRYPPHAQLTNNAGRIATAAFFPSVQPNEFCGEFVRGLAIDPSKF